MKAQWDKVDGRFNVGMIASGSSYTFYGSRVGSYASFIVHSYTSGQVFHVYVENGIWQVQSLSCSTPITIS